MSGCDRTFREVCVATSFCQMPPVDISLEALMYPFSIGEGRADKR
jgi:hypothetical protein